MERYKNIGVNGDTPWRIQPAPVDRLSESPKPLIPAFAGMSGV
jgi:hypothetical protein